MTADHLELAFDLTVYDPAQALVVGGLAVRFQPVPHYIPANAVELTDGGRALRLRRRLRAERRTSRRSPTAPTC